MRGTLPRAQLFNCIQMCTFSIDGTKLQSADTDETPCNTDGNFVCKRILEILNLPKV